MIKIQNSNFKKKIGPHILLIFSLIYFFKWIDLNT